MTSIRGYTELIQSGLSSGDTSKLQKYFEAIMRNTERLSKLTDDLLNTQRIEEGRMVLMISPILTSDLLRDFIQEATPKLASREQTLEIEDNIKGVIRTE